MNKSTICILIAAILYALPQAVWADFERDREQRFINGLLERRLFRLAESYCRQQLEADDLAYEQRTRLMLEIIRCQTGHAVNSPPGSRDVHWKHAHDTAADFLRQYAGQPRLILIRVQDALTHLTRGELLRQEAELLAIPGDAAEQSRGALRQAVRSLDECEKELTREIPLRTRGNLRPGQLAADELISLRHDVLFQLARAYRNQALCYPAGSDDRLAGLTQAVEQLNRALTQIHEGDPLIWKIRLDQAVCQRLLGNFATADRHFAALVASAAAAPIKLRAQAELVRSKLDQRDPDAALEWLKKGRTIDGISSADWDLVHLETYIALWKQAAADDDEPLAVSWRRKAVDQVKFMEQYHGAYWGRRADLLLVRAAGRSELAGDVEILARRADELYRKNQTEQAMVAYEEAAEAALASDDDDRAFELRYKAALINHKQNAHHRASVQLRSLAMEMPQQEKAANVHLMAVWNAAQAVRGEQQTVADYQRVLDEHIRNWPASPTADTARVWLGKLLAGQKQWAEAAAMYQHVSPSSPQFDQAIRAAVDCWHAAFTGQQHEGHDTDAAARKAAAALVVVAKDRGDDWPETWSPLARFCALEAAKLLLNFADDGFAQSEEILRAALLGKPAGDANWQTQANALLVIALAGQAGGQGKARALLLEIGNASSGQLLDMLDSLTDIARRSDAETREDLAQLQLSVTDRLLASGGTLNAEEKRELDRVRAESLATAGRRADALEAFSVLAAKFPDDGNLQEQYADLLLQGTDKPSLESALVQWRRIANRSRPQTDQWYRAKYSVALALWKLGQHAAAAARIQYLKTVPPGITDETWKAKFDELQRKCQP